MHSPTNIVSMNNHPPVLSTSREIARFFLREMFFLSKNVMNQESIWICFVMIACERFVVRATNVFSPQQTRASEQMVNFTIVSIVDEKCAEETIVNTNITF